MNKSLKDQLKAGLRKGKIKVKYPDGYKKWKAKFDHFYRLTKSVEKTFDIMYGPGGGVDNYRGSLYRNSNIKADNIAPITQKKPKKHRKRHKKGSKSKVFNFIKKDNTSEKEKK